MLKINISYEAKSVNRSFIILFLSHLLVVVLTINGPAGILDYENDQSFHSPVDTPDKINLYLYQLALLGFREKENRQQVYLAIFHQVSKIYRTKYSLQ